MADILTLLRWHYRGLEILVESQPYVNKLMRSASEPVRVSMLWFGVRDEPNLRGWLDAGDSAPKFVSGTYRMTQATKPMRRIAAPMAVWTGDRSCVVGVFEMGHGLFNILKEVHENSPLGQVDVFISCEMSGKYPKYAGAVADGGLLRGFWEANVPLEEVFQAARRTFQDYKDARKPQAVP